MPITPRAIRARRKAITFGYGDDQVNVDYYPAAIGADTVATLERLQADATAAQGEEAQDQALLAVGAWFVNLIAWWDYTEDDGETMQPITARNMATQVVESTDFMQSVLTAILADRNQGNANGTTSPVSSAGTSSRTASSASMRASRTPSPSSSPRGGSKARRH